MRRSPYPPPSWGAPMPRPPGRVPVGLVAALAIPALLMLGPHAEAIGAAAADLLHTGPQITWTLPEAKAQGKGGGALPRRSPAATARAADPAVEFARAQLGKPYAWGEEGPGRFDCSGLTYQAWVHAGLAWGRMAARDQYAWLHKRGAAVRGPLQAGDLVFYAHDRTDPSTIHHVAIVAGGGRMIEAPRPGATVRLVAVRSGWLAARPGLVRS